MFRELVVEKCVVGKQDFLYRPIVTDNMLEERDGLVEGEPKKMSVDGKEAWLLFPAKLYCGQSLLDSRRESVIIDYFFSDELPGREVRAEAEKRASEEEGSTEPEKKASP